MDPDLELLERWRAGDGVSGQQLFARHFAAIYQFFEHKLGHEADELAQRTFMACVAARDRFRGGSTFRTYLFAIARNTLYRYWRDRGTAPATVDFEYASIAALSTTIGTQLVKREDRARLHEALLSLPLEQQLLIELHYWEGLDAEQLAEVFETAPATSRSRLFRAREALREKLVLEGSAPTDSGETALEAWARALLDRHDEVASPAPEPPEEAR